MHSVGNVIELLHDCQSHSFVTIPAAAARSVVAGAICHPLGVTATCARVAIVEARMSVRLSGAPDEISTRCVRLGIHPFFHDTHH